MIMIIIINIIILGLTRSTQHENKTARIETQSANMA